ncbi:MAG: TRAP transporter small permease [Pseudomonadota bacterium]
MARILDKTIAAIAMVCGAVAALTILVLAGFVLASIVSRLAGLYVPGLTDYAGYCLAIAGAFGMSYTFAQHGHIRVEVLLDRLRGRVRFVLEIAVLLLSTAMAIYLARYLILMTLVSYDFQDRSDGSDEILIYVPQIPFAAGFFLFAVVLVLASVRALVRGNLTGLAAARQTERWD